jgi:hypothetical protein
MKNTIIIMAFVLLMIPMTSASDFSSYPMQSAWGEFGIISAVGGYSDSDGSMTRSSTPVTGMDYTDPTWENCAIIGGAYKFNVVPVHIDDYVVNGEDLSTFDYYSLIVPYEDTIVQYGADCSVLDTYEITDGEFVSHMAISRSIYDSVDFMLPRMGIVKYGDDNKTYMQILTFNETSMDIILEEEVLINANPYTDDYKDYYGTAGGCMMSGGSYCVDMEDVVFSYIEYANDSAYYIHGVRYDGEDWVKSYSFEEGDLDFRNSTTAFIYNGRMLFFEDMDADGDNEFIAYGVVAGPEISQIKYTPDDSSPYYKDFSQSTSATSMSGTYIKSGESFINIHPCQIGADFSAIETCYNLVFDTSTSCTTVNSYLGVRSSSFDSIEYENSIDDICANTPIFSYKYGVNGYACYYDGGTSDIICINADGTTVYTIPLSGNIGDISTSWANSVNVYQTEIDGDTTTAEILFSNGVTYSFEQDSFQWNGSVVSNIDGWTDFNSASDYGQMFSQDLNGDGDHELVYASDTQIRIYSNDLVAFNNIPLGEEEVEGEVDGSNIEDEVNDAETESEETGVPVPFIMLQRNIETIIALAIIIALVVMVAGMGITNPVVLMFVGLIGAIIGVILGLISATILILIIVGLLVIGVLARGLLTSSGE